VKVKLKPIVSLAQEGENWKIDGQKYS